MIGLVVAVAGLLLEQSLECVARDDEVLADLNISESWSVLRGKSSAN